MTDRTMFAGLALANVAGVPASTLLGQQLGWRWVFGVVRLIGAVAALSVAVSVPDARPADGPVRLGRELRALGRRPVWMGAADRHRRRAAGDASNLASGANQAAFDVANALGAALGGVVIAAGLGYASPNLVAAGLAVAGLGDRPARRALRPP